MSVIGYAGGKSKACKTLSKIWRHHYPDCDVVISPFFGGGSFEYFLQRQHGIFVLANDCDSRLIDFWTYLQLHREELISSVRKCPRLTYEKFHAIRHRILNTKQTWKQRALDFYVLNRCSFGALTLAGGFAASMANAFHSRSADNLRKLDLSRVQFSCSDWESFTKKSLQEASREGLHSALFLDPPYYFGRRMRMYGRDGDVQNAFDHQRLFKFLSKQSNWMLCYNNCEYIRHLYRDKTKFIQIPCRWQYSMTATSKAKSVGTQKPELVILPRNGTTTFSVDSPKRRTRSPNTRRYSRRSKSPKRRRADESSARKARKLTTRRA